MSCLCITCHFVTFKFQRWWKYSVQFVSLFQSFIDQIWSCCVTKWKGLKENRFSSHFKTFMISNILSCRLASLTMTRSIPLVIPGATWWANSLNTPWKRCSNQEARWKDKYDWNFFFQLLRPISLSWSFTFYSLVCVLVDNCWHMLVTHGRACNAHVNVQRSQPLDQPSCNPPQILAVPRNFCLAYSELSLGTNKFPSLNDKPTELQELAMKNTSEAVLCCSFSWH